MVETLIKSIPSLTLRDNIQYRNNMSNMNDIKQEFTSRYSAMVTNSKNLDDEISKQNISGINMCTGYYNKSVNNMIEFLFSTIETMSKKIETMENSSSTTEKHEKYGHKHNRHEKHEKHEKYEKKDRNDKNNNNNNDNSTAVHNEFPNHNNPPSYGNTNTNDTGNVGHNNDEGYHRENRYRGNNNNKKKYDDNRVRTPYNRKDRDMGGNNNHNNHNNRSYNGGHSNNHMLNPLESNIPKPMIEMTTTEPNRFSGSRNSNESVSTNTRNSRDFI
jgi:hypothetical protein